MKKLLRIYADNLTYYILENNAIYAWCMIILFLLSTSPHWCKTNTLAIEQRSTLLIKALSRYISNHCITNVALKKWSLRWRYKYYVDEGPKKFAEDWSSNHTTTRKNTRALKDKIVAILWYITERCACTLQQQ